MQDFGTKADNSPPPGGQLSAAEFNNLATENENAVLHSGQVLSGASGTQLAQSLFLHGVKAESFQDSGSANAYVATPVSGASGVLLPSAYTNLEGAVILFKASNANSGASTLNIGQTTGALLGAKAIRTQADTAISANSIIAGQYIQLKYNPAFDSGNGAWELLPWAVSAGPSRRNILINAQGFINERIYVSGTPTVGANQYTVDRWYVVTSGQSLSWSDSGGIRTFTAPAGGVTQAIRAQNIIGGTYVLSYTGTAVAKVNGVTVANGATFTLPPATIARLNFSAGTFSNPQIELGAIPTRFDFQNDEQEQLLCQKYYFRPNFAFTVAGYGTAGGTRIYDGIFTYPRMIGTPTATISTGSGVNLSLGALSVSASGLTQIANTAAAGVTSYLLTVISIDAEFT